MGDHAPDLSAAASPAQAAQMLSAALAASDPPGWSPGCGRAHPVGGYVERVGSNSMFTTWVEHRDAAGQLHRSDGPAALTYHPPSNSTRGWSVAEIAWREQGRLHRGDGPAMWSTALASIPLFYLRGQALAADTAGARALVRDFTLDAAAGLPAREAMGWLALGSAIGREQAATVRAGGENVAAALAALEGGVLDLGTLVEVAAGVLPASWAAAGLETSR